MRTPHLHELYQGLASLVELDANKQAALLSRVSRLPLAERRRVLKYAPNAELTRISRETGSIAQAIRIALVCEFIEERRQSEAARKIPPAQAPWVGWEMY